MLVHRDFHDGQVLLDESYAVGLIDFDLMAAGDPALDVANFLCHLELREHQGGMPRRRWPPPSSAVTGRPGPCSRRCRSTWPPVVGD